MRKGAFNFQNFTITVNVLHLSWIRRLLEKKSFYWCLESYSKSFFFFFEKYGGLNFLLKCNYNAKKLDKSVSLLIYMYLEMLDYFKELRQVNQGRYECDLILWNNQDNNHWRQIAFLEEVDRKWNLLHSRYFKWKW